MRESPLKAGHREAASYKVNGRVVVTRRVIALREEEDDRSC